ncbi:MAG: bifunctional proline dehydrogenase/L-glutamate gamma-semialdehyde dehydrogenase PutA [Acetobacteraceae bacterium]|nr:bifunctional proline dehydrogenase/L-glutamate gamma-semialdehyde dehydrogenase PutA [Acetobacteraceae bacterium]
MEIPFAGLAHEIGRQSPLRAAITAATRPGEAECVPPLIEAAALSPELMARAQSLARQLVRALRAKGGRSGLEALMHEYDLSSQEGVALMCLAEALLRIPDTATRDALIRDKVSAGDWRAHLGRSGSIFVNAATWGLLITGRLTATSSQAGFGAALARLVAAGGEPLIRAGVDLAMRMLGEQFVAGQTIEEALDNGRRMAARGFRYSYDMLGEAALTTADAERYYAAYAHAIGAIGHAGGGRGLRESPGISVKLSALHPRYSRSQRDRVIGELGGRLRSLAVQARRYDLGLNIDAEEADRLELSLDLLEMLCAEPALAGWDGIGFVVQAYQKRAPFVIDWLIDLARRSRRRLMVRLVKGAYWDTEIKRAQVEGLEDFPVYTRKLHTDVCYLACARKMLAASDAVFPQYATHNALTLATIYTAAGENFEPDLYEFQCLHGMGEPLYEEVVGAEKLNRPCRIYAPVGTYETLLPYLVRRLLENGANTSFVNRIANPEVSEDLLVADPVAAARAILPLGAPHPRIARPPALFGVARANSLGLDLANEQVLAGLAQRLRAGPRRYGSLGWAIRNPADNRDIVGRIADADPAQADGAIERGAGSDWRYVPPGQRAACLLRAADMLQARMPELMGLIVREAGRTLPNAAGEVREAIDFLRYYGTQVRDTFANDTHRPLGPVACISPWNFPLSIFTGQVAAALAAGNTVLAKPAEQTPLIAAEAVHTLHEAGVPPEAVQLVPGGGDVGAQIVSDPRVQGVLFTGSIEVARLIQRALARRTRPDGELPLLIAETSGQNAMMVDASALPEQVVADVLASAFDSAGQRCSSLRVLCLQEEIADRVLELLRGAMAELVVGNPGRLSTDVGPVISAEAAAGISAHLDAMRGEGRPVHQLPLSAECRYGSFVAPALVEIEAIAELDREVFGPVLHVLRFRRDEVHSVINAVNATGYALTFGIHSRIDETIAHVAERIEAGNIYVNRSMIGAVVGVQPFGGHGLSGTGPKAGGPLYLRALLSAAPPMGLDDGGRELPGPAGERNRYTLRPRGTILCMAQTEAGLEAQLRAACGAGNQAVISAPEGARPVLARLPPGIGNQVVSSGDWDAALFEGAPEELLDAARWLADRPGAVIPLAGCDADRPVAREFLVQERTISTNTAAAGGNPSLMTIG